MTDQRFFGIDISAYQGVLDWDIIAGHVPTVMFAGIRAGISWGYTDKWFTRNQEEAKRVGIPRTFYHVFYPAENAARQVANLKKIVGDDIGELPITADVELVHNVPRSQFAKNLKLYLDEIEKVFGRKPIIYSRGEFINYSVGDEFTKPYGNSYYWWMAHYNNTPGVERVELPAIPHNVNMDKVILHQNGDKFKAIGGTSSSMDFNRWLGSSEDFYEIARIKNTDGDIIVEDNNIDKKIVSVNTKINHIRGQADLLVELFDDLVVEIYTK